MTRSLSSSPEPHVPKSGSTPWGSAIVVKAFMPGPARPDELRAAEAAVAWALRGRLVDMAGWFERLEERPVREETMGQ